MKNPETGECRGFGFVTFEQRDAYDEVLRSKNQLLLDQRNLDPKPAVPKNLRSSTLDRNGSRNRGRGAFRGRGGGFNDRSRIGFNSVGGFSTTGGANMAPSYGSFPRNNVAS